MRQLQTTRYTMYTEHNELVINEKHKPTTMKNFTQNVKIILNFFPYLLKKIYFKP
ncbi:hypothetical protein D3C87_329350 [compost metagenome]